MFEIGNSFTIPIPTLPGQWKLILSPAYPLTPKMEGKKRAGSQTQPTQCQPYTQRDLKVIYKNQQLNQQWLAPPSLFNQQTKFPQQSPWNFLPIVALFHFLIPGFITQRLTSKVPPKPLLTGYHFYPYLSQEAAGIQSLSLSTKTQLWGGGQHGHLIHCRLSSSRNTQPQSKHCVWTRWLREVYPQNRHPRGF